MPHSFEAIFTTIVRRQSYHRK